ncbi:MAG: SDR family oxidoreductase [Candidatus Lokiarchaeota archaeon]|nr:SDR family oxidoreductase [Candidatus Lokiarchaeota archaeon]
MMLSKKILKKNPFTGKNVIVCGGSRGIGKDTSKLLVSLGANTCVVAIHDLQEVKQELESRKINDNQRVTTIYCDCTDYDKLKELLQVHIEKAGHPDYLINVVGYARPNYIENLTLKDFQDTLNQNYFGQLIPTLIVLPYFIKARRGHLACVSSLLGFIGAMGYTTYSPTKFALVGLLEALRNELSPLGIHCSVLYPPDTRTPGFEQENEFKPKECKIISKRGKILEPSYVAEVFIRGIINNKFSIFPGKSKLFWRVKRMFPSLIYKIIDSDLKKARKQLGKY